ncbi:WD40-repeat-containing domain protein [Suillus spraguei]|nr:WD40-repeat-containing domain protein [Suillus spraguei]
MEPSLSPIRSLRGHTHWVQEVQFSKNNNKLNVISTSDDKTVRIWDVETGEQEYSLEGHASGTSALDVSMDGGRIVSGAKDGNIIWDTDTKKIIRYLSHHTDNINSIQFSPDEKRLASTSSDGTLMILDTETWEIVFNIDDHQDKVWELAYSPNGTKIASGSYDQTVCIWNAATSKQQTQLLFHDAAVSSIVWSSDSCHLISACNDGQINFWSAPTSAKLRSPLHAHSNPVHPKITPIVSTVAFSPDGQLVATGCTKNTIFLWDISQEYAIMTNVESPSFVSPVSNITSYIDQPSASSDNLSTSSAPASYELPDGTEFQSETTGSRHVATSPSPSLLPQGRSNHEIPSPIHTPLPVELPDEIQVPPETTNSRDAAVSPSPSLPPQSSSHPQIATASASTPVLASP